MAETKNKLITYLSNKGSRELISVQYTDNKIEASNGVEVHVIDVLDDIITNERGFSFNLERKLHLSPENLFDLSVKVRVSVELLDEYIGQIAWADFDIKSEIRDNCQQYISDPLNHISLIISQITASFSGSPIITPPALLMGEE
jgi:hypothetical protein